MKWSNKKTELFWKLLGKLEHKKNDRTFIEGITGNSWKAHFKNVLQSPHIMGNHSLPRNSAEIAPLDSEITREEIDLGHTSFGRVNRPALITFLTK